MKIKVTRAVSIPLLLVMLLFTLPFSFTFAARYETSGTEFMDETAAGMTLYDQEKASLPKLPDGSVPPQFKNIQGARLYINYRLWKDEGVLCYGNYKNVPGNDFKAGTQAPGQSERHGANDGYYANPYGGSRGEWRYHGYDVSGNKLTNIFFIPDSVVTKFDERDWVKNPWVALPINKQPTISVYNKAAIQSDYDIAVQSGVQQWINKSMSIYGGVPLLGSAIDPEVYRYLNVESAPTTLRIGQGRMWHIRPDSSVWYQTVAVPAQTEKKNLPVDVKLELLTKIDKITDLGKDTDNTPLNLQVKVTAVLNDSGYYNNNVKETVYYTRDDIEYWTLTFNDTDTQTQQADMPQQQIKAPTAGNTGSGVFTLKTTYGVFRRFNWDLYVTAKGEPVYKDKKVGYNDHAALHITANTVKPAEPPVVAVPGFVPKPEIPETAFEGVPFSAADNTDMSKVAQRRVYVDGAEVDQEKFFSGKYIFPGAAGVNGRFAYVDCVYRLKFPADADPVTTRDFVYIYPTKPIANFRITSETWRQNRLINVQDASEEGNIQLVVQRFPIVQYEWSFGGDAASLRKGTDTDISKQLLYKQPGVYSLTLRVKNSLGRWSDPYTVSYQVLEDIPPALGVNLSESVYTRNDKVSAWYYCCASTDGDSIKSSNIELWYDSNNDGEVDRKLNTWNNQAEFPAYAPAMLGYYKYVLTAKEDITSDTLPQYITENDKKSAKYEVEFWVDNYRPLSDLYVNIPIQRPSIDVYLMLDKNLNTDKKDYILGNRVNMANWLLGKNIVPNVNIWDMRTYTYSQPANTSYNSGGSYPPATLPYASNGYSGTLTRSSVSNNSYSQDNGRWGTKTESKTAYGSGSGWASISWYHGKWGWYQTGSSQSFTPSISYSDSEGYSGTLSQTSYSCTYDSGSPSGGKEGDTYTQSKTFSASYSGTVYRTVQYWIPNIVWYDNYTGYYTGTIYKNVRQPYTDTFSPTSQKYVIYISDSTISDLSDLNLVIGYAKSAKLFLAGTSGIKSQLAYDQYFDVSGKSIAAVADEILRQIAENSPAAEKYCVLQNEEFLLNAGQIDLENDSIIEKGMQYVHEPGYFDNPTGTEPGTVSVFSEASGWSGSLKSSFANTGKYTIYRRVKDRPSTDPNFACYSYYSGISSIEIYAHRKPLAQATLDWDYDSASGDYLTTWVDNSYDPDHQYSRADKGIVERNIMYRRSGGPWYYNIPDRLSAGTYELRYYVKDPEGAWSDPLVMNFTLDNAPPMQFNAALRPLDSKFSLSGIPASEKLEAYELWTRFPGSVRLEMALYNGPSAAAPLRTVSFGDGIGARKGNDINWNNVIYPIPETLPDRAYDFRITAIGDGGRTASKSFSVNVSTPLELEPSMPSEAAGGSDITVSARTSKYADIVSATLFNGTSYARTINLAGIGNAEGSAKAWEGAFTIPGNIPDGNYTARFTAIAPNGSKQTKDLTFSLVNLAITDMELSGYWNHWRGQVDIFGKRLTNEPHRFLSLECIRLDITTIGDPERVTIRFSPELEAMQYTDPGGHAYNYSDYFGHDIVFPRDSTITVNGNRAYWEYNLPLAASSKDWNNNRLRQQYKMTVTVYKGGRSVTRTIDDIDITGNIYDLTYIQPKD